MRLIALTPFLLLAACSGGEEPKKAEADAPATQLSAGQWEVTSEVTQVTKRDEAPPAINAPEGSSTTTSICVPEADAKKPPPALFAREGFDCTYRDIYMSGGRINATLGCKSPGLSGDISTVVNGSYTADTIEGTSVTETRLVGSGDVKIAAKLTGRRTGACTAPAA